MTQFIDINNVLILVILISTLALNKRFFRGIIAIFEAIIIFVAYYYFLSHYKDITILNMIVAYNPVETLLGVVLRLNIKPSGAFSQFAGFTIKEVMKIIVLSILTKLVSPVTEYIYRIREILIKAFSEIGFTHLEETYHGLYA